MTVTLYTPEGDLPLGDTFLFLSAIAELACVAGDEKYPHLHGLVKSHAEKLGPALWTSIRGEAKEYLERHGSNPLSVHPRWILEMIIRGPAWLHDLARRAWEQHRRAEAEALPHLVRPAAPILFFGDSADYLRSPVRVLTVGLNPSCKEFPGEDPFRRFDVNPETDAKADLGRYIAALNAYFRAGSDPYDDWFRPSFEPILSGMSASYYGNAESTALHTDLCSPLATDPTWKRLGRAEQKALQREGVELWHDLVEELQPDVVVVSICKALLKRIRFPARGEEDVLHTVLKKKDGTSRKRPYRVWACRRRLHSGKEPLFVFGFASQTPFGSVSAGDKLAIGTRIRESLGA